MGEGSSDPDWENQEISMSGKARLVDLVPICRSPYRPRLR